uniref:Reverse transcriptase Ty1/copia-type domain-containing protein n=1 Tax=Solanum lycopersicum TaxID=4081 RepID=A0A3Q7I1U2_SOLLC
MTDSWNPRLDKRGNRIILKWSVYRVEIIVLIVPFTTIDDCTGISSLKKFLHAKFHIKDLSKNEIFLSQRKYVFYLLAETRYRRLVGKLNYLTMTCPDITYAVSIISQFMSIQTVKYWAALEHIFIGQDQEFIENRLLDIAPFWIGKMHQSTNTDGSLFVYEWSRYPIYDITHFRSLIGALQYLAITHPDIQFAINRVAQRMHQPSEHNYHCLKRILRYIFGTLGRGLLIRPGDLELRGFSDSDWANDKNDRKSTSGFLGPNLISWCTKKQPKVSRSSTEAEYRALALLAAET